MKHLLLLLCYIYIALGFGCSKSTLSIACPGNVAITIPSAPVALNTVDLPELIMLSDCESGGATYSVDMNSTLEAGPNTVTYNATDACGDEESCSFNVEVTVDFRAEFTGNYKGYRDCGSVNQPQYHPDQEMSVKVDYGNKPNYLKVGADQVEVDSNGSFPHPYFNGYRQYGLHFKNDSIFIYQQWGVINSHESCWFRGKKE